MTGVSVFLRPVRFDVPVSEEVQRTLTRIPGLRVCVGQSIRQGKPDLYTGQLSQEMFHRQVLVGEIIQEAEPISLVIVQVSRPRESQDRKVQQVIQFAPECLCLARNVS